MRNLKIVVILTLILLFIPSLFAADLTSFWTIDLNGSEITQEIFANSELTMINVWATFCPPCLQEMPALAQLSKEYNSSEFQVIGIVTDVYHSNQNVFARNLQTANQIIARTGASYIHLLPSQDLHNLLLKDVQVVPETLFVDKNGKIVGKTYQGARNKAQWKNIIDSTIALVK